MATKPVINLDENYQLIAEGICLFTVKDMAQIRIHVGASAPDKDTDAFHKTSSSSYSGGEKVYARANEEIAQVVVTEVV